MIKEGESTNRSKSREGDNEMSRQRLKYVHRRVKDLRESVSLMTERECDARVNDKKATN